MFMVENGEKYIAEITGISSDGNGVGTVDGFTVFVPYTVAGDTVEIEVTKVKSHYALSRLVRIITPSKDRITPECGLYPRCGGCGLLHMNYNAQREAKKGFIEAALRRIGGFKELLCDEFISPATPVRYRNKCIYQMGKSENGLHISGFFANGSHDVVPVSDCLISPEINSDINAAVTEYSNEYNIDAKSLFIRHARATGEIMVMLSIGGNRPPEREELIRKLLAVSDKIVSVYIGTNNGNRLIYGKPEITDMLCGIRFNISPESFYQINPYMTEMLYNKALEYAEITKNDIVLDIYCGIGTISLAAAKRARRVTGIEIVKQAVADAEKNARRNGISNAEFFADSAENAVPRLIESGMKPDVVILDPPRRGSDEATLRAIVTAAPKRIVYVSCNPATLARDAKYLAANGYTPARCAGADMFPGTVHVETVLAMMRIQ